MTKEHFLSQRMNLVNSIFFTIFNYMNHPKVSSMEDLENISSANDWNAFMYHLTSALNILENIKKENKIL